MLLPAASGKKPSDTLRLGGERGFFDGSDETTILSPTTDHPTTTVFAEGTTSAPVETTTAGATTTGQETTTVFAEGTTSAPVETTTAGATTTGQETTTVFAEGTTTAPVETTDSVGEFVSGGNGCRYLVAEEMLSYTRANRNCKQLDARLASFASIDQLESLNDLIDTDRYWTGGRTDTRGIFSFTDGTKGEFRPSNDGTPSQCLAAGSDGAKLMDCSMMMPYICQRCNSAPTQRTTRR